MVRLIKVFGLTEEAARLLVELKVNLPPDVSDVDPNLLA